MSELGNKTEQVKGKLKEAAGDITDDDSLRNEGKVDHASGTAKEKVGELKDKAEQAIDSAKDTLTGDAVTVGATMDALLGEGSRYGVRLRPRGPVPEPPGRRCGTGRAA